MRKFTVSSKEPIKVGLVDLYYNNDVPIEGADDLEVRDEYHSMHELYQHRMALNIALFHFMYEMDKQIRGDYYASFQQHKVMKSKLHADGTMFEGYFIVMAVTPYGQISYHYKLEHWDKFNLPVVENTPPWDGHSSLQVIERLMKL
jgi:hypothetical protein